MYLDAAGEPIRDASRYGWRAVGVPGTVAGLDRALREYGSLPRAQVMAPAIALARDGFVLGPDDAALIAEKADRLAQDPEAARIFLRPDGRPREAGDRLTQPDLAATLSSIAEQGPDAFYRGPNAEQIAAASGGALTKADFAAYTTEETPPLSCTYRGYRVDSAPPPSSGGTVLCEMLNVLGGYGLAPLKPGTAATIHLLAEAMSPAYLDRNAWLGDPAFVKNPLDWMLSPEHAAAVRA